VSAGDEDAWEEFPTFQGVCICDHEREEHGWGDCDVEVYNGTVITSRERYEIRLACLCGAGWEE
jgi:hypothetical protein